MDEIKFSFSYNDVTLPSQPPCERQNKHLLLHQKLFLLVSPPKWADGFPAGPNNNTQKTELILKINRVKSLLVNEVLGVILVALKKMA